MIHENLKSIHTQLTDDIKLIAVSKTQPIDKIQEAINAGQRIFGENRVQEAQEKFTILKQQYPDLELHLIGPLQTNKVKEAITLFDVIETVDRPKLAEKLADEFKKTQRFPKLLIQVNTGNEKQKSGISTAEADEFIVYCCNELKLPIIGLMCIPPINGDPSVHFSLLHEMAKRHKLKELSMGMTKDFEIAIQFGATYVRVGTGIFGSRY